METEVRIILASGSPRRRELLEAAGLEFEVIPSSAEEVHDSMLGITGLCEENARLKAAAVAVLYPNAVVIGADTLVFINGEALGKPKDLNAARKMMRKLSGTVHQVCTGVCIASPQNKVKTFHGLTDVHFRNLSEMDIDTYLSKTQPLDKAGAYGIQDHGELIVEKIVGDFDNVMGLPVSAVLKVMDGIGLPISIR